MAVSEDSNNLTQRQNAVLSELENREYLNENTANVLNPTELLTEFLSCIMTKDYEKAFNYCNQILSFEPNNSTAQEFYPLILQKLEMKFEESTSESSDSGSTVSSGSFENGSFQNDLGRKSFQEASNNYIGFQNSSVLDAFNALNVSTPKTEIPNENKETIASDTSPLPMIQNPNDCKREESKLKRPPRHEAQLPSKQTKKKKTPKSEDSLNTKVKKLKTIKQEMQKVEARANISQKKTSSKILLQPTKTITFPKELPPSNMKMN